jgi:fructose PTS system EIIBC or EIIC component
MKLVAITNCPSGIAHTYMAAEALLMASKSLGQEIKIETQGSIGTENTITVEDLENAAAVIIASDKDIDKSRFKDIPIIEVNINEAIMDSKEIIIKTLALISKGKKGQDEKSKSLFGKIQNIFKKIN